MRIGFTILVEVGSEQIRGSWEIHDSEEKVALVGAYSTERQKDYITNKIRQFLVGERDKRGNQKMQGKGRWKRT